MVFLLSACFGENIDSLTHLQTSKMQADYMIEYLELTRKQVYAWYSDITADSKQTDDNFNHNLKRSNSSGDSARLCGL